MAGSDDLVPMLAQALGTQKAREVVESTAAKLGFQGPFFSRAEALSILESLANGAGTVAIVARFARARVLLQQSEPPLSVRSRRS